MASDPLKLQLIDGLRASVAGRALTISSAPARLALGYLALSPGKSESRAKLAAMIWEESDDYRARRNLRQLLYGLRADLGRDWDGLETDRSRVTLRPDAVQTDCEEILDALRTGQVPDAIVNKPEIHMRLLSALPEQGELFASWLHLSRKEFENQLNSALEKILAAGNPQNAEAASRALLSLDASNENAARSLIRLYYVGGDTGRALGRLCRTVATPRRGLRNGACTTDPGSDRGGQVGQAPAALPGCVRRHDARIRQGATAGSAVAEPQTKSLKSRLPLPGRIESWKSPSCRFRFLTLRGIRRWLANSFGPS